MKMFISRTESYTETALPNLEYLGLYKVIYYVAAI